MTKLKILCVGRDRGAPNAKQVGLFVEGREAELFAKCRHCLRHPVERAAIAAAGRRRCALSDSSNKARLGQVLRHLAGRGSISP